MDAVIAVNNLDPGRSRASLRPFETDPPVLVYPDTPLPLAPTLQAFEPVAGARHVAQPGNPVNLLQLARGGARRRKRPVLSEALPDVLDRV